MTGWALILVLIAASLGLLWWSGVRGGLLQLSAAALLFGAAGYALQGRPGLKGSTPTSSANRGAIPLTAARHAFFGDFTGSERWLLISESYARRAKTDDAAGVLRSAVRLYPHDPHLWIGLGNALVDHARGLTPASQFAFARAHALAPNHPAPRFFLGFARARSGDRAGAVALWADILADAPADAGWRPLVEDAILALGPAGSSGEDESASPQPRTAAPAPPPPPDAGSSRPRR